MANKYSWGKNSGRELHSLQRGDPVKIQQGKKWKPAKVINQHISPRSYVVQTPDGMLYRRNRRNLHSDKSHTSLTMVPEMMQHPTPTASDKATVVSTNDKNTSSTQVSASPKKEQAQASHHTDTEQPTVNSKSNVGENLLSKLLAKAQQSPVKTTRSGRMVKPPQRFQDYEQ